MYKGFEIEQTADGLYVWVDERGFTHNGKIDTLGGYDTVEQVRKAIDSYQRNIFGKGN